MERQSIRHISHSYLVFSPAVQREAAIALVAAAISSGIFNDLGSGSNVDVCVITKEKTDMYRGYEKPNERGVKEQKYGFDKGTTPWTREQIRDMIVREGEHLSQAISCLCGVLTGLFPSRQTFSKWAKQRSLQLIRWTPVRHREGMYWRQSGFKNIFVAIVLQ
jgi:hypothetical protein